MLSIAKRHKRMDPGLHFEPLFIFTNNHCYLLLFPVKQFIDGGYLWCCKCKHPRTWMVLVWRKQSAIITKINQFRLKMGGWTTSSNQGSLLSMHSSSMYFGIRVVNRFKASIIYHQTYRLGAVSNVGRP